MFENVLIDLSYVWESFDWFGLASYSIIMTALDLILILLGNNVFMVLVIFFLTSRWGKEQQKLEAALAEELNRGVLYRVNMNRRVL